MKRTISLVLSSGGARGIAHIGVIEELERQGFTINSIAGTSMGSLVGGVFASGNLKFFREWICKLDKKAVFSLVDFTLSSNGLVKGIKIINEIKKIVPEINIEDLPIHYAAIATDIINKKEIVFENGSLFEAIRASISIPAVFKPVSYNNGLLIDGGVVNPLPIKHIKNRKENMVIAVDVNAPAITDFKNKNSDSLKQAESDINLLSLIKNKAHFLNNSHSEQLNYYHLISESARMMIQRISEMTISIYKPDIVIQIPINTFGVFEFYRSEEIINTGKDYTIKALNNYNESIITEPGIFE